MSSTTSTLSTSSVVTEILQICQDKKISKISELLVNCNDITLYSIKKNLKTTLPIEDFFVFTDGNCKSNGKKGARAGYSVYFEHPLFHQKFSTTRLLELEEATNNKAELTAILNVFKILTENINDFKGASVTDITICTDSMYSINCVNTWYRNWIKNGWKNSKNESVKNKEIIEQIINLRTWTSSLMINTSFKYVPSHKDEPNDISGLEHRLWKGNKYVDDEINKLLL